MPGSDRVRDRIDDIMDDLPDGFTLWKHDGKWYAEGCEVLEGGEMSDPRVIDKDWVTAVAEWHRVYGSPEKCRRIKEWRRRHRWEMRKRLWRTKVVGGSWMNRLIWKINEIRKVK